MPSIAFKPALDLDIPVIEIVDVGAMIEAQDRYASLVAQGIARVTGFEANPDEYQKLLARRGPYRYLNFFVGRGGPAAFHVTRYPGCSSLLRPDPRMIDLFTGIGTGVGGNFTVERTLDVNTTRLDDVDELPAADYLKLDVQGAELDVLSGATRTLQSVLVIELEAEFVPLYEDQPLFGDIQCALRERGFVFHKLIDVAGRAFRPWSLNGNQNIPISQLLWADAIFVRDFTRLDSWTEAQLLKGTAVLHEAYRSCDLAYRLLAELDTRTNGDVATRYGRLVTSAGQLDPIFLNVKLNP